MLKPSSNIIFLQVNVHVLLELEVIESKNLAVLKLFSKAKIEK